MTKQNNINLAFLFLLFLVCLLYVLFISPDIIISTGNYHHTGNVKEVDIPDEKVDNVLKPIGGDSKKLEDGEIVDINGEKVRLNQHMLNYWKRTDIVAWTEAFRCLANHVRKPYMSISDDKRILANEVHNSSIEGEYNGDYRRYDFCQVGSTMFTFVFGCNNGMLEFATILVNPLRNFKNYYSKGMNVDNLRPYSGTKC